MQWTMGAVYSSNIDYTFIAMEEVPWFRARRLNSIEFIIYCLYVIYFFVVFFVFLFLMRIVQVQ